MSLANATTRTAADDAFVAKALSDAQRAIAKRQSPTVVKPASCLAKFKAAKEAERLPAIAEALPLVSIALPVTGSITAAEFLHRVNHVEHGVSLTRDGIIVAIAAYTGYNRALPFGLQEFSARWSALREVRGKLAPKGFKRGSFAVVGGYVHGMPFETQKVVMDLMARERVAAEDLAAAEHAADKCIAEGGVDMLTQAAQHRQMAQAMQDEILRLRGKLSEILNAC